MTLHYVEAYGNSGSHPARLCLTFAVGDCVQIVENGDLHNSRHGGIYEMIRVEQIKNFRRSGTPMTALTLRDGLRKRGFRIFLKHT